MLRRLFWPFLVYEVPITALESLEMLISGHLRRWLGVPRSFSSVEYYSSGGKLQLPMKSLTEKFKVTKVRQVIMLRDSNDEKVKQARVGVRKWKAAEAFKDAESRLHHRYIVGTVAVRRQGLG